jgi:electron transfer flavoprotein beta subunit
MKILVPIKKVVDPAVRIRVKADGTGVDLVGTKLTMNPFDEIALEEALRLREAKVATEVVIVTIGLASVQDVLRAGLAMGADRSILVQSSQTLEPLLVAKSLASIVERESPSLIIAGKQAIDDDANQTGQMLAGLLGWPQATFASSVRVSDNTVLVTREVDGGHEMLSLTMPAVVTADLRLNEPRYATLPNIMRAKSKPLEVVPIESLGVDLRPRLSVVATAAAAPRLRQKKISSVDDVAQLLQSSVRR